MKNWMMLVDDYLKIFFRFLGNQIGTRPGYFVIVPLLLTALAASGFQRIVYEADPEFLFSPSDGPAKQERATLERHFPTNYSEFDPGRMSRGGRFGRLIFRAKDNGTLLRENIFNQILFVDDLVRRVSFYDNVTDTNRSFTDVCAISKGYCWDSGILGIGRYMAEIEAGNISMTYPIWFDPETFERYTFPFFMGGIELHPEDLTITSVKVLNLNYFLNSTNKDEEKLGAKWEAAFLKVLEAYTPLMPDVDVFRSSSLTLEQELENNTNSVMPFFSMNIGLMVIFCVITCMMTDCVKSKPYLGLLGVISAILASFAAFGLCMYLGIPFIGINLAAPFLMLGIGIDDTFVILGAWRRTSPHLSVVERMAITFEEAAVSITITSVTDMLSFLIGIITPFPCVKIFCIYSAACVIFTYVWHITFFGACIAISGYSEKDNRHSVICMKVKSRSQSKKKGALYTLFCAGGINPEDPWNPLDNQENGVMAFFRDVVAAFLNKKWVKVAVLIVFLGYLAVSSWAFSLVTEGLDRKRLTRFDSYSVGFYELEDQYFRDYPYRISVVVSGQLDYSDTKVQQDLMSLLSDLENTTYIAPEYTESWLRDFLDYVRRQEEYDPVDISTEEKFIEALRLVYLDAGPVPYGQDVDFSEDGKHIIGARFMIQGSFIKDTKQEGLFVQELRDAISKYPAYTVATFHPYFIFFDQFLLVLPTTLQCVTVAAGVMIVVSLIFIPNPMCSLWVAFSILSIEVGVVGLMTLWGVHLDSISMINLIMCIGFSVDFSAHISYHFMSLSGVPVEEKVRQSLYALGLPIFQGATSTIIGVIGLALAPSYIFITFFKMIFLVIVLGALHGLILLPVLLSLFGPEICSRRPRDKSPKVVETGADVNKNGCAGCNCSLSCDKTGSGAPRYFVNQNFSLEDQIKIPRPTTTNLSGSRSTTITLNNSSSDQDTNDQSSSSTNQSVQSGSGEPFKNRKFLRADPDEAQHQHQHQHQHHHQHHQQHQQPLKLGINKGLYLQSISYSWNSQNGDRSCSRSRSSGGEKSSSGSPRSNSTVGATPEERFSRGHRRKQGQNGQQGPRRARSHSSNQGSYSNNSVHDPEPDDCCGDYDDTLSAEVPTVFALTSGAYNNNNVFPSKKAAGQQQQQQQQKQLYQLHSLNVPQYQRNGFTTTTASLREDKQTSTSPPPPQPPPPHHSRHKKDRDNNRKI